MTPNHGSVPMSSPNPQPAKTNLLAVASGKGGVGKTWFSITLSHALAFAGERILLFDGDVGLANVDIQLGLAPKHDLGSVLSGRIGLREAVMGVDGGAAEAGSGGGFDVLAGKSGSGALADMAPSEIERLREGLRVLSRGYDRVIVDLAAGIGREVRSLCTLGGPVLVVVTDEPTSLTDAYALVKMLTQRARGLDLRVVVNLAASLAEGERTYDGFARACQHFLDVRLPLLGVVRRDPKIRETIRSQVPLFRRYPQSQAAGDVVSIARALKAEQAVGALPDRQESEAGQE